MHRVSRAASPSHRLYQAALCDRRGAACLLGVVLLLALAGCGRVQQANPSTQDSFSVTLATDPAPPVTADGAVADGAIIVTLRDAAGQPVDNAQLAVEANMSHAGMTPVMASSASGKDGAYRVPLTWTMAGDWYVDVRFTLPDGQKIARRFPVNVLAR
jgi:hypothetical protein